VKVASCHLSLWYLSKEEEQRRLFCDKPLHITRFLNRTQAGAKPSYVDGVFGLAALRARGGLGCLRASVMLGHISQLGPEALARATCPRGAAVPMGMPA